MAGLAMTTLWLPYLWVSLPRIWLASLVEAPAKETASA